MFADADSADFYPRLGQPAYAAWRPALVTLMQYGLLQARGRSRTHSTHVLAAVRDLNRLELWWAGRCGGR